MPTSAARSGVRRAWYRQLYPWVLIDIAAGIAVGALFPKLGENLQPLGTTFVDAIKMIVEPIIFCTVVGGIAQVGDLRRVGRLGLRTIGYFEFATTLALILGLERPAMGVWIKERDWGT